MKLKFEERFEFTPEQVMGAYRDRMNEYIKFVPNITSIKIESREELGDGKVKMRVIWEGMGQIPEVIRGHLKPEMICWQDDELWDPSDNTCKWKIIPYYFTEFVKCEGAWHYDPDPRGGTKVWLEGVFEVNIRSWPGIPRGLLKWASRVIERMIGGYVEPNLSVTVSAVKKLMKEDAGKCR